MTVEGLHSSNTFLRRVDVGAGEDFFNGEQEDAYVGGEGAVVDVPHVQLELALPGDGIAAVDLGPAGDAGADVVAAGLFGRVEGEVLHQQGAGADEGHVAAKDVYQLGKFVDGGGADESTDAGEAVGVRQQVAVGVALIGHGFELDDFKNFAVQARALLGEERVAPPWRHITPLPFRGGLGRGCRFIGKVQPNSHNKQYWPDDEQRNKGYSEVDHPLKKVFIHNSTGGV